jgi:hypothetical protein
MKANIHYCLLGDDQYFRFLIEIASPHSNSETSKTINTNVDTNNKYAALDEYKKKYQEFFIQDYLWTQENLFALAKQEKIQSEWYSSISKLNLHHHLELLSVEEFKKNINLSDEQLIQYYQMLVNQESPLLVDIIFEYFFKNRISKFFELCDMKANNILDETVHVLDENNLLNAFVRYMCNQLYIFDKFSFVPKAAQFKESIINELLRVDAKSFNLDDVERIRNYYERFVTQLKIDHLITPDDYDTFIELYSIVPPFYVNYDIQHGCNLMDIAYQILGINQGSI